MSAPDDTPDLASGAAGRPTLRTLSERTGLHVSTVSRALRRDPASDPTAALVHTAASELGYRRDPVAASLRTRRSGAIGMVAHALTDVVQAIVHEAIDQVAVQQGYDVLVASTRDDPAAQRQRVELLLSRRVDGLIIADAHEDGDYVDWVATLGIPYVLVMRRAGDHPAIVCDDREGGRQVGRHLVAQGHREIALLAGPGYSATSNDRAVGFREALAEAGVDLPADLVEPGGLHPTSGREGMDRLLARRPDLTAVFCASDFSAFGATTALRAAGLVPGRDVATVGFNDVTAAAALDLSSVRSAHAELGELAARTLIAAIDGVPAESASFPATLVVRGSSATPLGGGAVLSAGGGAPRAACDGPDPAVGPPRHGSASGTAAAAAADPSGAAR
ncbi:LacI family DNA-binding transcriptional regulator [Patulibacter sp. NPDC049589]|uniref:LacI family DNA-binding transcriptional regulator n=1 Tax=Patulibacter sp. NPDC049589 TaxID=3154731 RepID=UPI00341A50E4